MVGQLNITAFQPTNMQSLCSAYWGSNKCSFGDAVFRLCFPHLAASAIIRTKWHHQWLHYTAYCTAGWKQSCLQSAWHSIISSLWRSVNPLIAQILTISRAGTFSSSVLIVLVASRIFFFCCCFWRNCYSGLPGYVEYEVAVAAQTAAGTGPYYNVLNFTTPEDGKQSFLTVSTLFITCH